MTSRHDDILSGRHYPRTSELLTLHPFYGGSIWMDIHRFTRLVIIRLPDPAPNTPEHRLLKSTRAVQRLGGNRERSNTEASRVIRRMMDGMPEDDHDGRLRCAIYRAALGDRLSQMTVASEATRILMYALAAGKDRPPTQEEIELAGAVVSWSSLMAREPLLSANMEEAAAQGRELIKWLRRVDFC